MPVPRNNASQYCRSVTARSSPVLVVGVVFVVLPVAVSMVVLPVCRGAHPRVPTRVPASAPRAGMMA